MGLYIVMELVTDDMYLEVIYYSCISVIVEKTQSWLSESK